MECSKTKNYSGNKRGDDVTTGQKIRRIRQETGMTQWQLSRAVGITPGAMLMIERGERDCSSEMIASIAEALGVPESSLKSD